MDFEEAEIGGCPFPGNLLATKNIFNDVTGYQLKLFHLEEATAVLIPMMGEGEPID